MDEKSNSLVSSSIYRPKHLSASATELSTVTAINGHLESNNNYCIKEEEGGDWEVESPNSGASGTTESPVLLSVDAKSPNKSSLSSISMDKYSMSALAKQDDEDYCILDSEDFETGTDTEGDGFDRSDYTCTGSQTKVPLSGSTEPCSEDESESIELAPSVPHYTLMVLTVLVYGYFVLPLPSYIGGMLLGIGLGFFLAIGVVWLSGPKSSGNSFRHSRSNRKLWNLTKLDIKEPDIFKVSDHSILNIKKKSSIGILLVFFLTPSASLHASAGEKKHFKEDTASSVACTITFDQPAVNSAAFEMFNVYCCKNPPGQGQAIILNTPVI